MSIFDRLDKMVSSTADAINATRVKFTPMRSNPNGRNSPDPDREELIVKGVFDYYSVEYGIQLGVRRSYREANDLRALQAGREPYLSIDRKHFPSVDAEPRQGDIIEFPDKPDLPRFEVISGQRDGQARMVLLLSSLGRHG